MNANLPLRLLLIAALVLWTPAWCCCAVRAAAIGESGEDRTRAAATCCSRTAPVNRPAGDCCRPAAAEHDRAISEPAPPCCGDDEHDCRCDDRPSETDRLDTAPKVSGPKHDLVGLAALTVATDDAALWGARMVSICSRAGHVALPPPTLLRQRCLLLI